MSTTLIYILITILLSAFFSGMEIAFVSSNKLLLEIDKNSNSLTSRILSYFYAHSNNFISTILVGNNIVVVIYGILMARLIGEHMLTGLAGDPWLLLLVQTLISTVIIIFTGEFIPKTLFKINPNGALKLFAVPTFIFYVCLYPISRFTTHLSYLCLKLAGAKFNREESDKAFSKTELDHLVKSSLDHADEKEQGNEEVKIFQNVLDFSELKVRDCYVPRTEIDSIDITAGVEQLKTLFIESGHSKVVVYKENIDNIIGYIHSSQLFRDSGPWQKRISKMPFVPETFSAQKMMKIFMQQKKSLAVVVDEFGGTSGIVSLEDIVEEIFGDIEDEHDNTHLTAEKRGENEYLLSGRLEIEKINETFDLSLPESDEYQTLGGLILYYNQSFPKLNETVIVDNFQFKIIGLSNTKIDLVQLKVAE